MTSSKEIDFWMGCYDPKSVILALEGLYRSPLIQVPDTDSLVFTD